MDTKKLDDLKIYLKNLGRVAVAFSGGVDSTFLLKVAFDVLGKNAEAFTVRSMSFPKREKNESVEFCLKYGIPHYIIDMDELKIPGFAQNPKNRCYICKHAFLEKMIVAAKEHGITNICEGSNLDDEGDYRPGLVAVSELGIKSPLRECNFTKSDIREFSKMIGLSTWNKPSFACLSSRFAYGEQITGKKLGMVDEAEQFLLDAGFVQFRVRMHGDVLARIEVPENEIEEIMKIREKIVKRFREIGFVYVSIDLQGYRTGSMNETLI